MSQLVLGLYAEGSTDERFLLIIIRRTAEVILAEHDRTDIEVLGPRVIEKPTDSSSLERCILHAAKKARGYYALIIHSDADDRGYEQTIKERFMPGYHLIQQEEIEACKDLVPIIPVRMVEAWMLADLKVLEKVLGMRLDTRASGAPGRARLVESVADPKEVLKKIIKQAYPHQWKQIMAQLYEQLAPEISIERLCQVPAYKKFFEALTETFKSLNVIH
jgi:hypothetical protein